MQFASLVLINLSGFGLNGIKTFLIATTDSKSNNFNSFSGLQPLDEKFIKLDTINGSKEMDSFFGPGL